MTELEALLNPEMEALLRELSARPRSLFLRADRRAAFRAVRSRTEEPISAMAVSDALERELVSVHRAELAEILRQACRTRLLEGEREKLFIMRYRSTNERVDPVPLADVRKRLGQASRAGMGEPWAGAIAAVQKALAPEDPEQVSVLDLAALGQRLVPGDAWRTYSAMQSLVDNNDDAVAKLAHSVLDGWPEPNHAVLALELLSFSQARTGAPDKALQLQEHACAIGGAYPIGTINRFCYALLAGHRAALSRAAQDLESQPAVAKTCILEACAAMSGRKVFASTRLSPHIELRGDEFGWQMGQTAWRVAHAI